MKLSAGGDVIEAAFPGKGFGHQIWRRTFSSNRHCDGRQKFGSDFRAIGEDRRAFKRVLKFTNVAWPGVFAQLPP
jgi:hypothetical protein